MMIGFDHELAVATGFALAMKFWKGAHWVVGRGVGQIDEKWLVLGTSVTHPVDGFVGEPSQADIGLTKKLMKAGESLDIKVLDHVIITEKSYFSFADENLL